MNRFRSPVALFVLAYLAVNLVNSAFTLVVESIGSYPTAAELGVDWLHDPAYQATVRWHPLISLAIFTGAALLLRPFSNRRAAAVGIGWTLAALTVDAVVYVWLLGDTRWGLPAHDYYVGNQPWITLSYLSLLIAPALAKTLTKRHQMV